jgi:glycosyltransferase involved in cell wall biosynthesis
MKYSLIICAYNPNPIWFREALESAKDLFDEIIVIDDHSDEPIEINYLPCIVKRNDVNLRFTESRNLGNLLATGDIIATLDHDDIFISDNVKKLKEFIELNDSDVWHFPIEQFGDVDGIWCRDAVTDSIYDNNQIPSGSWYKRKVWEEIGGFKTPEYEDWNFWLRLYKQKKKFTYFPFPVYRHRIHQNQGSVGLDYEKYKKIAQTTE